MRKGLNMSDAEIEELQLHDDLMSSEDEGVSHPPSYRLQYCTDFLHNTVDRVQLHGKTIDCVVGWVRVKRCPGHLLGNRNVII